MCNCVYCVLCNGSGIVRQDKEWIVCSGCSGSGVVEYCERCKQEQSAVEKLLVDVADVVDDDVDYLTSQRDKKLYKRRHGMRVSNRSIFTLKEVISRAKNSK